MATTGRAHADRVLIPQAVRAFHAALDAGDIEVALAQLDALRAIGEEHPYFAAELRVLTGTLRSRLPRPPKAVASESRPGAQASDSSPAVLRGRSRGRARREPERPASTPRLVVGGGLPSLGKRR